MHFRRSHFPVPISVLLFHMVSFVPDQMICFLVFFFAAWCLLESWFAYIFIGWEKPNMHWVAGRSMKPWYYFSYYFYFFLSFLCSIRLTLGVNMDLVVYDLTWFDWPVLLVLDSEDGASRQPDKHGVSREDRVLDKNKWRRIASPLSSNYLSTSRAHSFHSSMYP